MGTASGLIRRTGTPTGTGRVAPAGTLKGRRCGAHSMAWIS
jgi:hypothetical protein